MDLGNQKKRGGGLVVLDLIEEMAKICEGALRVGTGCHYRHCSIDYFSQKKVQTISYFIENTKIMGS